MVENVHEAGESRSNFVIEAFLAYCLSWYITQRIGGWAKPSPFPSGNF